jgi:hypothetical protein
MKGYWPEGSDWATVIVVGRFVVAGYHHRSCIPGLFGSFWRA